MDSVDWNEGENYPEDKMGAMKKMQECKPDYEKMIGEAKEKQAITQSLFDACEKFILKGPRIVAHKHLKALLGFLYIDITQRAAGIDELMEAAEKET
jgi:hypothetical protein